MLLISRWHQLIGWGQEELKFPKIQQYKCIVCVCMGGGREGGKGGMA